MASAATHLISSSDSSSESDQDLGKKPPPSRPSRKRRARGGGNNSKTNKGNGGRKNKKKKMDNNNDSETSTVASAAADTLPLLRRESSEADVCSVCLDKPVHPVALECNHVFCYLCAKGLVEGADSQCSLCRRPIAKDYLKQDRLTQRTRSDLEGATEGVAGQQWFYEGRGGGWWKFEVRLNQEIEEGYSAGAQAMETLICGNLYVVDFQEMAQYRKDMPDRKRKIKRDVVFAQCKGVAGLVPKNN